MFDCFIKFFKKKGNINIGELWRCYFMSVRKKDTIEMMSFLSGRADLNRGPHGPEPCALAGLSYAPMVVIIIQADGFWQGENFNFISRNFDWLLPDFLTFQCPQYLFLSHLRVSGGLLRPAYRSGGCPLAGGSL